MFTIRQTQEFQDWLDALKDVRAQVRIAARLRLAEAGNPGDWKSVGNANRLRARLASLFHAAREHSDHHARGR